MEEAAQQSPQNTNTAQGSDSVISQEKSPGKSPKNHRTRYAFIALGVIALLTLLFVGVNTFLNKPSGTVPSDQTQKYSGPVEKVTIGISATAPELSTLILIAKKQNFFINNGVQVEIKTGETAINVIKDLDTGAVDLGTLSDFVYVSNSFTSAKNLIILSSINKAGFLELVARRSSGIYYPKDLKGKKIGVTLKTSAEYYLGRFLTFNDLTLHDVNIVPVGPAEVVGALQNGTIDATTMGEPQVSQLKAALGSDAASWSVQGDERFYWVLVASEETVSARKDVINRVLQSLVEAEDYAKKSPDEAQKIVAEMGGRDVSYISNTWNKHDFAVSLDQSLLLTMEDEARWRIENKLTEKTTVPNYLQFIYFDGLKEVKPDAMTIIH